MNCTMKRTRIFLKTCGLFALLCLFQQRWAETAFSEQPQAWWVTAGSMNAARYTHTATLLPGGNVLITGGYDANTTSLSSAELYDHRTKKFVPTGSMCEARSFHTATLLPNGKVLIVGGNRGRAALSSAEIYDPAAGTFLPTGSMITPRNNHIAILLKNGKVLVAGGYEGRVYVSSAELYDPATGRFSATGSMGAARNQFTATLLPKGKVLVTGGQGNKRQAQGIISSAELYDPASGTFSPVGSLTIARFRHSATLLPGGKILLVGGFDGMETLSSAELYDPARGTFTPTGSMSGIRQAHVAILLPNGKVLVTGGADSSAPLSLAELYDPASGMFSPNGSMSTARSSHSATLLPGGKVLATGGHGGVSAVSSAELYAFSTRIADSPAAVSASAAKQEHSEALSPAIPQEPARVRVVKMPDANNVAVADFIGKNVSQADASIVAGFLRTELVNTRQYKVMDRSNMDTVLAEQKFQNSGCTEQECAVEMGKLLNVRRMYVGSLSKLLDSYYITVNEVDVATGEITASYDSDAVSAKKLKDACKKIVVKISGK